MSGMQSDRQRGWLLLLTRLIYWLPGSNPCQFPDLLGRRIRTEAGDGGSLGRVVAVVVPELVLLLSFRVGGVLEVPIEPGGPTKVRVLRA